MKVDPLASVAVITAPRVAPERTTVAPDWSVVVTTSVALVRRVLPLGTGASTELTTSPFWLTATLATGDVVETVEPRELVVTTTTPGKRAEVVIARPSELVVVKVCSTLTDADCWKAEVVSTTVLPWLFVLDRTTGTITPEAVEAAAEVLEAAIWREAVAEVTTVLPAELVEVMATTVGSMELAAELAAELSADDAAAELSEEAAIEDATTDEPRPEETAAEEEDRAEESEEASEGEEEDCAAEEDAAAEEEESESCWEETELWAAEEASEDEVRVEVTRLEPEVETTTVCERDAGEAEMETEADEADGESALLSPPVVLD
jgi:cobalamin biosynthesis protein CobT